VLIILTVLIPGEYLYFIPLGYGIFYAGFMTFFFVRTIQIVLKGHEYAIFILLFLASYSSNMFWGGLINAGIVDAPFYPFDFLVTIFVIVLILFKRQNSISKQNEQYTMELQKMDKRKDEFLTNTSHELRNPLQAVLNIAHTVLEDKDAFLPERNKKSLQLLIQVGQQMKFTLNDLVDVSRLQEKDVQLHRAPVNLHNVASVVLDMHRFTTEKKT